jgi:hypothetical protein
MSKLPRIGLVVEGNVTRSSMLRLRRLPELLGPIKATLPRVAKRLSNFLHGGYVAQEYQELEAASLILLRMPDSVVVDTVAQLAATDLPFRRLAFVLCESWLTSDSLSALAQLGSTVASVVPLPGRRNRYLAEGKVSAIRTVRSFLEYSEATVLQIRPGSKARCFAAGVIAGALPMPLYLVAQQALRESGVTGNNLTMAVEEMAQTLLREFTKGARATWGGPLTEASDEARELHMKYLALHEPELKDTLDSYLNLAKQTFRRQRGPRRLASTAG